MLRRIIPKQPQNRPVGIFLKCGGALFPIAEALSKSTTNSSTRIFAILAKYSSKFNTKLTKPNIMIEAIITS